LLDQLGALCVGGLLLVAKLCCAFEVLRFDGFLFIESDDCDFLF